MVNSVLKSISIFKDTFLGEICFSQFSFIEMLGQIFTIMGKDIGIFSINFLPKSDTKWHAIFVFSKVIKLSREF